jgi:tetratricopeptide (TPR) repeat protein
MSQSHALFQEVGERLFLVETTSFLGSLALQQGDCATAARYGRQALELARALKSKQVIMRHLSLIGMAAWYLEDYPQMTTSFQEKLALSQELGDKALIAISLRSLGMAALRQGRTQEAAAFFLEAVRRDQGAMKERIPAYLAWFSEIALAAGQWSQAARLLGALESKIEAGFRKLERWDMEEVERCRAALQAQLDKDAFTAAFEEGKAFSLDMALAEALALGREVSQPN